jgi:2-haloacid dehalogenase
VNGPPLRAVVFDVNETLSDMSVLRTRFENMGVPGSLLPVWFAGVLRDGIALTASGSFAGFAELAADGLRGLLRAEHGRSGDVEEAVAHVMDGFAALPVHPDVPEGVRALRAAGLRLATMTNGSTSVTRSLLERAGVLDCFEELLDVTGPRAWKPAPAAYRWAVDRLGVRPGEALLAAVHPWDVDGARGAGLHGAWLRRGAAGYPSAMTPPSLTAEDVTDLARLLARS